MSSDFEEAITAIEPHIDNLKAIVGESGWIDGRNRDAVEIYENSERGARGYTPLVLKPKSAEQVKTLVGYANSNGLHFIINAGRTGLVEAGIPKGEIVLSTVAMNKINSIVVTVVSDQGKEETKTLSFRDQKELQKELSVWKQEQGIKNENIVGVELDVEAAVSIDAANNLLAELGWHMPIGVGDKRATICGCLANGAAGDELVRADMDPRSENPAVMETCVGLATSINGVYGNGEVVDGQQVPRETPPAEGELRLNSGVFKEPLLAYSQGVLGIITSAKVQGRYKPAPEQNQAVMVSVPDDEAAQLMADQVKAKFPGAVVRLETISGEMLELLYDYCGGAEFSNFRQWKDGLGDKSGRAIMAHLVTTGDAKKFEEAFQTFVMEELASVPGVTDKSIYYDDYDTISTVRHDCTGASNKALGKLGIDRDDYPKYRFSPDVSVPTSKMGEFLHDVRAKLQEKFGDDLFVPDFGHFERGGSHLHILSTSKEKPLDKDAVARIVIDTLKKYGGSISAEHGAGTTKLIIGGLNEMFADELERMAEMVADKNPNLVFNPRSFGMDKRLAAREAGFPGAGMNGGSGHASGQDGPEQDAASRA